MADSLQLHTRLLLQLCRLVQHVVPRRRLQGLDIGSLLVISSSLVGKCLDACFAPDVFLEVVVADEKELLPV